MSDEKSKPPSVKPPKDPWWKFLQHLLHTVAALLELGHYVVPPLLTFFVLIFSATFPAGPEPESGGRIVHIFQPARFPAEWHDFWILGTLALLGSFATLTYCAFRIFRRIQNAPMPENVPGFSYWTACKQLVVIAYREKRFYDFSCVQAALRATLLVFVLLHTMTVVVAQGPHFHSPLVRNVSALHIVLGLVYLLTTLAFNFRERRELEPVVIADPAHEPALVNDNELVASIFWRSARLDLIFATAIWVSTVQSGEPFHLAFILPFMSTWLYWGERAKKIFIGVLAALLAHSVLQVYIVAQGELHTSQAREAMQGELLMFLAELSFWTSVCFLLVLLQHMRDTARDRVRKLSVLRAALVILGTQRNHAVFAKDVDRKFIFANEVFLKHLAIAVKRHPELGLTLDGEGRVRWRDVEGKTDGYFDIDEKEYRESDLRLLNKQDEHYAAFETAFNPEAAGGAMIWTQKEPIYFGGKIVGIAGFFVPGLPVELQKMKISLTDNESMFASMKDAHGYIVWVNSNHLHKLKDRIRALVDEEYPSGEFDGRRIIDLPIEQQMQLINHGHGPTDNDLYGPDGDQYRIVDMIIAQEVEKHLAKEDNDPEKFDMENVVTRIKSERHHELFDSAVGYPGSGWMEFHQFPGEKEGRWVQVWKLPRWQTFLKNGKRERKLDGILVVFEDDNRGYLRKSISWRWIEVTIKRATEANRHVLSQAADPNRVRNLERMDYLAQFPLPELLRQMLAWARVFIEHPVGSIVPTNVPRHTAMLGWLIEVIVAVQRRHVHVNFEEPESGFVFQANGDMFFAVAAALVYNAVEAALHDAAELAAPMPVEVKIARTALHLELTVVNSACDFSEEKKREIDRGKACGRDHRPGGGIFIAKHLTRYLGSYAAESPQGSRGLINAEFELRCSDVTSDGRATVTAFVAIPLSAFEPQSTWRTSVA